MNTEILKLIKVRKEFRSNWTLQKIPAVQDASFAVIAGETFGFLGHNGAGKTTTIKTILGLVRPNGGEIFYDGAPLENSAQRKTIGYLPELPYFYEHLTVRETLRFFADLYNSENCGTTSRGIDARVAEILELVGLSEKRDARVYSLSKGQQQRLGLAQAIIHKPKLLLLDEPFSGLDPIGRLEFKRIILGLRAEGSTVVLSSHVLSDVQSICDRVVIMVKGTVRDVFAIRDIPQRFGERFELTVLVSKEKLDAISKIGATSYRSDDVTTPQGVERTFLFNTPTQAEAALRDALGFGLTIREFRGRSLDLEEVFMKVTQGGAA